MLLLYTPAHLIQCLSHFYLIGNVLINLLPYFIYRKDVVVAFAHTSVER